MSGDAPFFRPGGTMDPHAPSYIERPADADLLAALLAREYVFLLDSRQKGKSSMVARTIVRLKEEGIFTVKLDLQRIGANVTPEQWYAGLLAAIGQELSLHAELFEYWKANQAIGPLARWIGAIQDVLLEERAAPIVVFIDEVDFVRALPFPTDEFFAGIRDCYNRRSEGRGFERLTFCIVGVATPGQLIRNPEITPFNIGRRIDITDFAPEDTTGYAAVLQEHDKDGSRLMARVNYWLNGHPYLTQLLCSQIVGDPAVKTSRDVDGIVKRLFLTPEARQREPNFSDVERRILDPDVPGLSPEEKRIQVLELYGRLLKGKRVEAAEENPVVATLRLSGVGLEDRRALRVRNRLYGLIFDERWRRQSLPDAEMRRQRGAARVALLRTATVAGVMILGVTTVALNTSRLAGDRERALRNLQSRTRDLNRVSVQRQDSLNDLERRTQELKRISLAREQTLTDLRKKSKELKETAYSRERTLAELRGANRDLGRLTDQRRRTIELLNLKTAELGRQAYNTLVSSIGRYIESGDSRRVSESMRRVESQAYRGWEWDLIQSKVGKPKYIAEIDRFGCFEPQANGSLQVATWRARYSLDGGSIRCLGALAAPTNPDLEAKRRAAKVTPIDYPWTNRPGYRIWTVPEDGRDTLCDSRTNRVLVAAAKGTYISDVDVVAKAYLTTSEALGNLIEIKSIEGGRILGTYRGPTWMQTGTFLPEGTVVGYFAQDGSTTRAEVHRWDRIGQRLASASFEGKPSVGRIAVSPDGQLVAMGVSSSDWQSVAVEVRLAKDLQLISRSSSQSDRIRVVVFSPDGAHYATGSDDATIRIYETRTSALVRTLFGQRDRIKDLAYSDSGDRLYSISESGDLVAFAVSEKPDMEAIPQVRVRNVAVSPDGRTLVYSTQENTLYSRDLETGKTVSRQFDSYGNAPLSSTTRANPAQNQGLPLNGPYLFVSRSAPFSYAFYRNGMVEALDPRTLIGVKKARVFAGKPVIGWMLPGKSRLLFTEQSPGLGALVETACYDAVTLKELWRTKRPAIGILTHDRLSGLFAVSIRVPKSFKGTPDRQADATEFGYAVEVLRQDDGKRVRRLDFEQAVYGLALSPDGETLAIGLARAQAVDVDDAEIRFVNVRTGKVTGMVQVPKGPVGRIEYSANGQTLTAMNNNAQQFLWDARTLKRIGSLHAGHGNYRLGHSPDGERIAATLYPDELRLWDAHTGDEVFSMKYPIGKQDPEVDRSQPIQPPWFSIDGRTLVVLGYDGTLRVWRNREQKSYNSAARR